MALTISIISVISSANLGKICARARARHYSPHALLTPLKFELPMHVYTVKMRDWMIHAFNTEDAMSLIVALCLEGFFLCFVIAANLEAWTKISRDKDLAMEVERREEERRRGRNVQIPRRISERELLSTAWFGGPCGLVAMFVKRHKIRKPMFLLGYCCRCIAGVSLCLVLLIAPSLLFLFLLCKLVSYLSSLMT